MTPCLNVLGSCTGSSGSRGRTREHPDCRQRLGLGSQEDEVRERASLEAYEDERIADTVCGPGSFAVAWLEVAARSIEW
jgi:homoserine acetyltransferase